MTTLPQQVGAYTAAEFTRLQPKLAGVVARLLEERVGLLRIADLCGVSVHTVIALRDRIAIPEQQATTASRAAAAGALAIDGIIDDLADPASRASISAKDKAIIAGVMVDKAQLLSGGPTHRIEIVQPEPAADDFARFMRAIPVAEEETPEQKEGELALMPASAADGQVNQDGQNQAPAAGQVNQGGQDQAPADGQVDQDGQDQATTSHNIRKVN